MTFLPEAIITKRDLMIVARLMQTHGIQIPIKGYKIYNGRQHSYTIGIASANDTGDDILIESRNIREPVVVNASSIYPQILEAIRLFLKSA